MKDLITIVSGLPRSGTSMMMQMLDAGGMEVFSDGIRKADEDNPKGYYELERAKKIKEDSSWLDDAKGKVFKMVSMLLYDLPQDRDYKVIFMKRRLGEVLASQKRMLERHGNAKDGVSDDRMEKIYVKHLTEIERWLAQQKNIEVIYIDYNDVIADSIKNVETINRFLGNRLDTEKMTRIVDKFLYRQRQ